MAKPKVASAAAVTEISITDAQQVLLTIRPVDSAGNPAQVEPGSVRWTSDNEAIVTAVQQPDEHTAFARATGPTGSARVSVSADADLGEGVVTIFGSLVVTVTLDQAVSIGIDAGDPEPKSPS